tara:strand:+ start:3878 stop:5293 length:1416 start_codon:yes stop_codon:yes gene_type:complete
MPSGTSVGEVILRNSVWTSIGASVLLASGLSLAACADKGSSSPLGATSGGSSLETKTQRDSIGAKKLARQPGGSFAGAVVADEPTAALAARAVLERGGNAADAATALYFALSVTYPAAAGLGGGGVCLAREGGKPEVTSIAFLPGAAAAGGSVAVPANVRGIALMQAKFGTAAWATLVSPAERLAATGYQVSRASAAQLADQSAKIGSAGDMARVFGRNGTAFQEGDIVTQPDLAHVLGLVRARGVSGFYNGEVAHKLVDQSATLGGALTASDLQSYRPVVAPASMQDTGNLSLRLAATDSAAGAYANALWLKQQDGGDTADMNYGSTSFATVDGWGGAVACALTMNGAFGIGHVADGTGIVYAATPASPIAAKASTYLVPMMVVRDKASDGLYAAAAAAGTPKGAKAIVAAVSAALTGVEGAAEQALASSGADARSPANAIICDEGLPRGTCSLNVSPRGAGVGFGATAR